MNTICEETTACEHWREYGGVGTPMHEWCQKVDKYCHCSGTVEQCDFLEDE